MALGSQIFKANINLANLNENTYEDIALTIALHPSETEERMMYRLIAFLLSYHERLEFTHGLDNPDLPDIWQKDLMGDIEHWIELGQPDEKKIKKASNKSNSVSIFTFNIHKSEVWLNKIKGKLSKNNKVKIFSLKETEVGILMSLVQRSLELNCLIEDNNIFLSNDDLRTQIEVTQNL